ncbi:chromosome partition protein Smc [bacterium MnTg02]|nr:chromosome partition protein Smc [bacterium MnTg02]
MQISRLRLIGFKSFVEPVDLAIERGLTGVVGPNGCGKSNLLEALRWVMGETSYKTMRGSTMEDVIFAGTQSRPARNSAEVTIFLDNSKRTAPADFNDSDTLEVTRRIERDIGSAYKINGKDVRARDVQLLFADASTGARSPALVQQGQIGEIVNSKPQARRRILEDAAGITGLHSRRHEAELRLRAAENNLERLQDIMGQIHSRLSSLKRQTRQAARYKELSTLIQQSEAIQFHLNWTAAGKAVTAEETALQDVLKEVGTLTQKESAALREQTDAAETLQPLRNEEVKCAAALNRFSVERDALDREEARMVERQKELSSQLQQFEADLQREQRLISEAKDLLTRLGEEQSTLSASMEGSAETSEAARITLEASKSTLSEAEAAHGEATAEAAELKARRQQLETTRAELAEQNSVWDAQRSELQRQLDALEGSSAELAEFDQLSAGIESGALKLTELEAQIVETEQNHDEAKESYEELRKLSNSARLKAQNLQTEVQTLTKLLMPSEADEWPPIVDEIRVTPGYEMALAAALGDDLDAPVNEQAPVHWTKLAGAGDDALAENIQPLTQFVEAPPELARRLAQIGIVDHHDGRRAQQALKPGQRLVSRDGDLWRWDGYTAAANAATAAAKRLAERNRLESLQLEMQDALAAAATAEQNQTEADARARQFDADVKHLRLAWRELQSQIEGSRKSFADAERRQQERKANLSALQDSCTRLDESLKDLTDRRSATDTALTALEDAATLEHKLAATESTLTENRTAYMAAQSTLDGLEREASLGRDRLNTIAEETSRWSKRTNGAESQTALLADRISKTGTELDTLKDLPGQVAERRSKLLSEISRAESTRKQAADALAEAENRLRDCQQSHRDVQVNLAAARENRARIEARLEAARDRRADQARQIRDGLGCAPEDCLKMGGLDNSADLPDNGEIETRLQKLKSDRERLGGVNLRADEEATELSNQYDEMDREKTDLEEAIARLRQGISNLNREGRKRLLEAFEIVNDHFRRLFTVLFGGGEAELQLVESDDPLEAGLEILARPPGKKPQVLTLLSGGEKALTAMSLIFAVFLTNPSPICVLDEVDAPLDDSNVDRFCTLLEDMAKTTNTRFLVITHHPMTMARVNRLFGVTMSERGISQLVSVDLATAESFREAS